MASSLGITDAAAYAELTGLRHWIAYVLSGLDQTHARFPVMA